MSKAGAGREAGSQNWKPDEVKLLSVRWTAVSEDARYGKDRKSEDFWKAIVVGIPNRTWDSARRMFGRLASQVQKFESCVKQIQNKKPSGVNNDDIIRMALELYQAQEKKAFKFVDAWTELRKSDKFNSRTADSPSSVGESSSANGSSPKCETRRPDGRGSKANKKRKQNQDAGNDNVERLKWHQKNVIVFWRARSLHTSGRTAFYC